MNRRPLTALVALLIVASNPSAALAQGDVNAPSGLSGADQYLETVPRSDGNASVGNGQRPSLDDPAVKSAAATVLPSGTSKAFAGKGESGANAAALAARTAPQRERSNVPPLRPPGSSALAALGRIVTGDAGGDGMGVLFPLLLIGGTLIVAGSALSRRRSGSAPA